jgi:hypothetical protein
MTRKMKFGALLAGTGMACVLLASPLPAQIPPHNTLTLDFASIVTTGKYSTTGPVVSVQSQMLLYGTPHSPRFLEVSATNSAAVNVSVSTHCTQAGPMLTCSTPYELSAADTAQASTVVQVRYLGTGPSKQWYHRGTATALRQAGQGGAAGSGVGTPATGASGPTYTQIPPHNTMSAITSYNVQVNPTPPQYDPVNRNLSLSISVSPNALPSSISPPYRTELLEVSSDSSPITQVAISSQCTRSGTNNATLNCTVPFTLPVADASQPIRTLTARYFADRVIPSSTLEWTGYSAGLKLINCTPGQCGTSGGGSSSGGSTGPLCPPEGSPMMPTSTANGGFQFAIPQSQLCPGIFFIDPPIATGYNYTATNTKFQQITMPSLTSVQDNDGYVVSFPGSGLPNVSLTAGQTHTLPTPFETFEVNGINPALQLSPTDALAFRTGVKMTVATGPVTINQTPITVNIAPPGTGGSVRDYFTDTFGDPLDYNNIEDVALVEEGPIQGVSSQPTLSGGQLHLDFNAPGYFSPAWAGYDAGNNERGSEATPHDREVGNHPIDPSKYQKVLIRMNVSAAVGAGVMFYTCPHGVSATCETQNLFVSTPGWKTYEFALPTGTPVTGIRGAISPNAENPAVHVDVDWVMVVGSEPGNVNEDGSVVGPVPEVLNPDIAGAVRYLFPLGGNAVPYSGRTCANNDFATKVVGNPWDFSSRVDILEANQYKKGWTANGIFTGQWDMANFGSRLPADTNLVLNMGKPAKVIDTATFHRATLLLHKYDGKYSQQFLQEPGSSGFVARIIGKEKLTDKAFQQFNPLVQYPNDTTLSVDLQDNAPYDGVVAAPTSSTEGIANQVGWVRTYAKFRVDIAEPYNDRFQYLDEVLLSTDDCGLNDFDIEFAENNNVGGTAELFYSASPLGPWTSIAAVPAQPGRNTYKWTAPAGLWWIKVAITNNGAVGENISTGPVRIGTTFQNEIAINAGRTKKKK